MRKPALILAILFLVPGLPARAADSASVCVDEAGKQVTADQLAQEGTDKWGVELASGFNKDKVLQKFNDIQSAHQDLLGSYSAVVVPTCDLSLGTAITYSLRVLQPSREDADTLCGKLSKQNVACVVRPGN
ncbi:hypothetical protein V6C03_00360 [Methyloligella sp. 2.7D]|uniref:hypothetical protein n=1 Tax=unclassified Methyloligella TaxID=2625955 RepID=UPI00157D66EF|nr:hypothetical protein [Methyloligella sp. GL2]QKP76875.1 hypothetical protein HT051_05050 [Methyloligella sp. GL2]